MQLKRDNKLGELSAIRSQKELILVKLDFGLTETELTYLLSVRARYRKNASAMLKKMVVGPK